MDWAPARIEEVERIVEADLSSCTEQERAVFKLYAVPPFAAPVVRSGHLETVVVVARKGAEVVYWEDVEEGFNTSLLGDDGRIADHSCNQDSLGVAIAHWVSGTFNGS